MQRVAERRERPGQKLGGPESAQKSSSTYLVSVAMLFGKAGNRPRQLRILLPPKKYSSETGPATPRCTSCEHQSMSHDYVIWRESRH